MSSRGLSPPAPEAGFRALRAGVTAAPLEDRSLLRVRGGDRASFLQGMLTNEIAKLGAGEGTRALLLTDQGRVVADLRVYVGSDEIWLDAPREAADEVRTALERFVVADDVECETSTCRAVAVRGRGAAGTLQGLLGDDAPALAELAEGAHCAIGLARATVWVCRLVDLGIEAYHLWAEAASQEAILRAVAGAGVPVIDEQTLEVQRVVSGTARLGAEFGRETLAPEIPSLESSISHRKGCYLGQEVVERIAARGHVNWKIVTIRSAELLVIGAKVCSGDADVGRVTSVARRPDDGSTWALARVRASVAAPGTMVSVIGDDGSRSVEVVAPEPRESED